MSSLINRVPTGRIVSLHAELQYLYWRFQTEPFTLQEMKLDSSLEKTQLDFFLLAIENPTHGRYNGKYDPYLANPLDRSGFHLTQSVERDSQKSKSASECFTALEGLGWIARAENNKGRITALGEKVAALKYTDEKLFPLIRESLLGYGPFVGFIFECLKHQKSGIVKRADIFIGYPVTNELLLMPDGTQVPISTGSQADSVTRTKSALMAWAMTAGFIWPANEVLPTGEDWHMAALKLLKSKTWTWTKFKVLVSSEVFGATDKKLLVTHPLGYKWMTKSTKALRERGQATIRAATMGIEAKIKNRRFAIVYVLALAGKASKSVDFSALLEGLKKYPDLFVINEEDFERAMKIELGMAITAGLIFSNNEHSKLELLVRCDVEGLAHSAPEAVVQTLMKIAANVFI